MGSSKLGARTTSDEVLSGMDLSGRTILITGANSGIGFEAARSLAAAGARTLLACRNREAGQAAVQRISSQHPHAKVSLLELDLGSFESVRRCTGDLPVDKLDAVICNAGLFASRYQATQDGLESTVGVCHFGHFLLVHGLLSRLSARGSSRVVMVSSESHRFPLRLAFDRFPLAPQNYKAMVAYGQAKLCNVLFANEFTRRYQGQGVFANSLHPGAFIGTSIFRSSLSARAFATAIKPFTKSIPQGAATTVYCAVSPAREGVILRPRASCGTCRWSVWGSDSQGRLGQLPSLLVRASPGCFTLGGLFSGACSTCPVEQGWPGPTLHIPSTSAKPNALTAMGRR
jgi:WW domain-containing oxidoreductase